MDDGNNRIFTNRIARIVDQHTPYFVLHLTLTAVSECL